MPTNTLILSHLNPVHFTKQTPDTQAQYVSKHMDDWPFADTILDWEQAVTHYQPWFQSDSIRLQLQSNYGPVNLKMINENGHAVYDSNFQQMQQNSDDPTLFIYQADLALNPFGEGLYYLKITIDTTILVSDIFVLSERIENTIRIDYSHPSFYEDLIFEQTDFAPCIRMPGVMRFKTPASRDTLYEDQVLNMTMLKSVPFRVWELRIGLERGIPDWMADKLQRILGCSTITIDGKAYTKNDGAKLEESAEQDYPMRGWTIEMREARNRSSRHYEDDVALDSSIAVVINVDSKGFGLDDAGGSVTQIEDIN